MPSRVVSRNIHLHPEGGAKDGEQHGSVAAENRAVLCQ